MIKNAEYLETMAIEPLYGFQIMEMLSNVTVLSAEHMTGDVPQRQKLFICNTLLCHLDDNGHWVAINIKRRGGEYFDYFGLHPSVYNFHHFLNRN